MDTEQIRRLKPKLDRFLDRFADCFGRKDTRAHLLVYVRGQLSDLPDKSVEPIAVKAGVAPRTLQEFLSQRGADIVSHRRIPPRSALFRHERAPAGCGDDQALISQRGEHLAGRGLGDPIFLVDSHDRRHHRTGSQFPGQDALPQGVSDLHPWRDVALALGHGPELTLP